MSCDFLDVETLLLHGDWNVILSFKSFSTQGVCFNLGMISKSEFDHQKIVFYPAPVTTDSHFGMK